MPIAPEDMLIAISLAVAKDRKRYTDYLSFLRYGVFTRILTTYTTFEQVHNARWTLYDLLYYWRINYERSTRGKTKTNRC